MAKLTEQKSAFTGQTDCHKKHCSLVKKQLPKKTPFIYQPSASRRLKSKTDSVQVAFEIPISQFIAQL